jgi:hypothetical protein
MDNYNFDEEQFLKDSDAFELRCIIKRQGKEWVASELIKYATPEEIELSDNLRKKSKEQ